MKYLYFTICLFILAVTQAQTTQDSLYVWKAGVLVNKQSIKPGDMDSITFKRPVVNLPHVTICSQVWATRNLDVTNYSDGTPIPQVQDPTAWANLTTGAWCYSTYYNNVPVDNAVYGKLYNWYAAAGIYDAASLVDPTLRKNLAPTGWHVPTDAEWTTLTTCLGGESFAGGAMKETGTEHWDSPNIGATNSSGFTGLPGGSRGANSSGLASNFIRLGGNWWSSSEYSATYAWNRYLYYSYNSALRYYFNKTYGFSVRCIRD
jgi:uncharacterized protein (TIGR02145 family)